MTCHSVKVHRLGRAAGGLILAALILSGCGEEGPLDPGGPSPGTTSAQIIISNPVTPVTPSAGQVAVLLGPVVYVSMPLGSFPEGTAVSIRNTRTGATVGAVLIAGGLDPVAVDAAVGDTLAFTITVSGESPLQFVRRVPAKTPPVIVRTDPPPSKRDVPLNAIIIVVFSEPVDAMTVSTASVRLTRNGVAVSGQLTLAADGLSATFQPDAPLLPSVDYLLEVTTAVADLDGDPLEAALTVGFVTQNDVSPVAGVYERVTPHSTPGYHSRYVLRDDGVFELKYETTLRVHDPVLPTYGNFAYTGVYWLTSSTISFDFDDWNTAGPWEATGTVLGDSLAVEYNEIMQMADFENGEHVKDVSSVAVVYELVTPPSTPGYHSRYVLRDDGTFELQYDSPWVSGYYWYTGHYWLTGSTITFDFDGWNTAGPSEATGTLLGGSLVVEFNEVMQVAKFENGVYESN